MSLAILEEVESDHVVKVRMNLVEVVKVESIVQLGKLKNHIDDFGLIRRVETAVLLPVENTFAALVDQMRTDRVLPRVECFVPHLL